MNLKRIIPFIIIFQIILIGENIAQNNYNLTVEIHNIQILKGTLYVYLYDKSDGFPMEIKKANKNIKKKVIKNNISIQFTNLSSGIYAVSIYQDVNSDNEMNTNFLGIPKEPIGVSNNAKGSFGPPEFSDAKFTLNTNKTIIISLE